MQERVSESYVCMYITNAWICIALKCEKESKKGGEGGGESFKWCIVTEYSFIM